MTIVDKSQLNWHQRFKYAFISQSLMPWLFSIILIIAGVFDDDRVKGIIFISLGLSYAFILFYSAYRIARTYIYKIEESGKKIQIYYALNRTFTSITLTKGEDLFRTYDKSPYSHKQIHFLKRNKTIIKQYPIGDWNDSELQFLENELKRIGFQKPYGENM